MREIRTILAHDSTPIRDTIGQLLALEPDIAVVARCADGTSALAAMTNLRPRVALLAADLPGLSGERIAARARNVQVVLLSSLTARHVTSNDNVAGYVALTATPYRIADAVRTVAEGGRFLDADLAYVDDDPRTGSTAGSSTGTAALTSRERSVLTALSRGGTVREISESVGMSAEAIGLTMTSLLAKTGGRNRVDATRIAATRGWI